jgi:hypothetical protein
MTSREGAPDHRLLCLAPTPLHAKCRYNANAEKLRMAVANIGFGSKIRTSTAGSHRQFIADFACHGSYLIVEIGWPPCVDDSS